MNNSFDWLFQNQVKEHKEKFNFDSKLADQRVKFCTKCKKCWEIDRVKSKDPHLLKKKKKFVNYYEDFPTWGKEKETCQKCKE